MAGNHHHLLICKHRVMCLSFYGSLRDLKLFLDSLLISEQEIGKVNLLWSCLWSKSYFPDTFLIHSFVRSFARLIICSFIRSFVHGIYFLLKEPLWLGIHYGIP